MNTKTKTIITLIICLISSASIVAQTEQVRLYNPFSIDIDPMERLLLVNIENDPDTLYIGFEPQVFDDSINGTGHLTIAWRVDGKVDVYHQPGLTLDPDKYSIAGKGLANMIERDLKDGFFHVNQSGVQAQFEFLDLYGRMIGLKINENHTKKRKPFGLLAPMGDAAENPHAMPLVLLQDFYFVRQKHSDIEVLVDGRLHNVDNLPVFIDRTKMTFIRYSTKPIIATLNSEFSGVIQGVSIEKNQDVIASDDYEINIEWRADKAYIKSIKRNNQIHPVILHFNDAFPNIADLENNSIIKGAFTIESHPSTGKIKGVYRVEKNEDLITISMNPSRGWYPVKNKLSLRFMYRVAKIFRKWPTTYEWNAKVSWTSSDYYMESHWKRINRE